MKKSNKKLAGLFLVGALLVSFAIPTTADAFSSWNPNIRCISTGCGAPTRYGDKMCNRIDLCGWSPSRLCTLGHDILVCGHN